jgi:hypothetical protein
MSRLTGGRKEPCKNNIGGIQGFYLSTFFYIPATELLGYREGVIYEAPPSLVFEYKGQNKTATETMNEAGGYDQELTISFFKQDIETNNLMELLLNNRLRATIVDRNGTARVYGVHNGLDVSVNVVYGASKVEMNGYMVRLQGSEPLSAPFLQVFPGSGFEKEGLEFGCLLASSSLPSSLSDLISSCNVVTNYEKTPIGFCFLASSGTGSGSDKILSECYG